MIRFIQLLTLFVAAVASGDDSQLDGEIASLMKDSEYLDLIIEQVSEEHLLKAVSLSHPKETASPAVTFDALLDTGAVTSIITMRSVNKLIAQGVLKQTDIISTAFKIGLAGICGSTNTNEMVVLKVSVDGSEPVDIVFVIAGIMSGIELLIGNGSLNRLGLRLPLKPVPDWPYTLIEKNYLYPEFKSLYDSVGKAFTAAGSHPNDGSIESYKLTWKAVRGFIEIFEKLFQIRESIAAPLNEAEKEDLRLKFPGTSIRRYSEKFFKAFNLLDQGFRKSLTQRENDSLHALLSSSFVFTQNELGNCLSINPNFDRVAAFENARELIDYISEKSENPSLEHVVRQTLPNDEVLSSLVKLSEEFDASLTHTKESIQSAQIDNNDMSMAWAATKGLIDVYRLADEIFKSLISLFPSDYDHVQLRIAFQKSYFAISASSLSVLGLSDEVFTRTEVRNLRALFNSAFNFTQQLLDVGVKIAPKFQRPKMIKALEIANDLISAGKDSPIDDPLIQTVFQIQAESQRIRAQIDASTQSENRKDRRAAIISYYETVKNIMQIFQSAFFDLESQFFFDHSVIQELLSPSLTLLLRQRLLEDYNAHLQPLSINYRYDDSINETVTHVEQSLDRIIANFSRQVPE